MKHRMHVNRHHIAANKKAGDREKPVFTVKNYKYGLKGHRVVLKCKETGKVLLTGVYNPDKPLNCGATLWMEFDDKNVDVDVYHDRDGGDLLVPGMHVIRDRLDA